MGVGVRPFVDVHGGNCPGRVGAVLLRADGVEGGYTGDSAAADSGDAALQRGDFQVKVLSVLWFFLASRCVALRPPPRLVGGERGGVVKK